MNLNKPNYLSRSLSANSINKHVERGLDIFFDDLEALCSEYGWKYDPPIQKRDNKFAYWKNNLVEIEQIEEYEDSRPKGFVITFFIPSFIGLPLIREMDVNLTENPPSIGYKHKIYVSLPFNYTTAKSIESSTKRSDALYIESRSQLFHPKFFLRGKSHGCLKVDGGEMSKIIMNLFHCLLWESNHVWKGIKDDESFINKEAAEFSKTYGNEIHLFLLEKMIFQWGLHE